MMHGCGGGFRDMVRMSHARCAPELMENNGYPAHHKVTPHWDIHVTKKNEFIRRTMIFNRYC